MAARVSDPRSHRITIRLNDTEQAHVLDIQKHLTKLGIDAGLNSVVRHALRAYATHIVYKKAPNSDRN